MTHREDCESYLRGLEGTRKSQIDWFGVKTGRTKGIDLRSIPKVDIPMLIKEIFNVIEQLKQEGLTILLVEQNAKVALKIADRGYVLETGRIVLSGTAEELMQSQDIQRAYLGSSVDGFLGENK